MQDDCEYYDIFARACSNYNGIDAKQKEQGFRVGDVVTIVTEGRVINDQFVELEISFGNNHKVWCPRKDVILISRKKEISYPINFKHERG